MAKPSYQQLEARLADAERVIEALRTGQVDAIIGDRDVALVRLREAEEALRRLNAELEARVHQRTEALEQANRALGEALGELRQAHVRMLEVERLTALGTIAAKVAHEINNPLMAAENALAFARRRSEEPAVIEALNDAEYALGRMARIGEAMLHMARPSPRIGSVVLADVIERTLALMESDLRSRGIDLVNRIDPGLSPVHADPSRLEQVFFNLVANARDAVESSEQKRIELTARRSDEFLVVSVRDTGVGIPEAIRERLFDAFFTTKPGQGTGLGLPIVKSIVESFGGWIDVESREGQGATFSVAIPLAEARPQAGG